MTRSVRRLYLDLGLGLAEHRRTGEAVVALQQALAEAEAADADPADIRRALAGLLDGVGRREEAFREYLQTTLERPALFSSLRPELQRLLTPEVAAAQVAWTTGAWSDAMTSALTLESDRASVALFGTLVHLMAGDHASALERFQAASGLSRDECVRSAEQVLVSVERILESRDGDGDCALAPAHQLRGEVLLLTGDQPGAGEALGEAARLHATCDAAARAAMLYERATRLKPDLQWAYWSWAECVRVEAEARSTAGQDGADDTVAALRRSLAVWTRGLAYGRPTDQPWAFVVRALILDGLRQRAPEASELGWEMVVSLEQTLVLDGSSSDAYAFLGRAHRALKNLAAAAANTSEAMEIAPDDPTVLVERSVLLSDLADPQAIDALDRYREVIDTVDAWAEAQEGYVLFVLGRHKEAAQFLERALSAGSDNLNLHGTLGRAYRMAGREDRAVASFQALYEWAKADESRVGHRGWAAYLLGHIDEARELEERSLDLPTASPFDTRVNLAYCALAAGDLDRAEHWFEDALAQRPTPLQLRESELDLADVHRRVSDAADLPGVHRAATRYRTLLGGQRRRLLRRIRADGAALDELRAAVAASAGEPGSVRWLGARFSLARTRAAERDWAEAVELCEAIVEHAELVERFPEVREGLVQSLMGLSAVLKERGDVDGVTRSQERLVALGMRDRLEADLETAETLQVAHRPAEALELARKLVESITGELGLFRLLGRTATLMINAGSPDDAIAACAAGVELAARSGEDLLRAELEAVRGRAHARKCDLTGAVEHFGRSLRIRSEAGEPSAADALIEAINAVEDPEPNRDLAVLSEALALLDDDHLRGVPADRSMSAIRRDMSLFVWSVTAPLAGSLLEDGNYPPVFARPVTLEADARLFPEGGDTPQVRRMIEEDIPSMRDRISAETGVQGPVVHIDSSDRMAPGVYAIHVHDAVIVRGCVLAGGAYCPDREACVARGLEGIAVEDPLDRRAGVWLHEDVVDRARAARLPIVDVHSFMLRHVESVIRENLSSFLGLDELVSAVRSWQAQEEDQSLRSEGDDLLADDDRSLTFLRVTRALVDESITLADLGPIVDAFVRANRTSEDVIEMIEAVRERVRERLPGADGSVLLVGLPESFEAELASFVRPDGRTRCLALPPEVATSLRAAVADRFAGTPPRSALVVAKPGLRPFVRMLVRDALPSVAVLARSELRDRDAGPSSWITPSEVPVVGPER